MIIAIARWLLTVISLSLLLTWCFLNRIDVAFDWSPAQGPVTMPLFGVILLSAVLGFIWGVLITWLNAADDRAEKRQLRRDLKNLERKVTDLEHAGLAANPDAVIAGLLPAKKSWWRLGG